MSICFGGDWNESFGQNNDCSRCEKAEKAAKATPKLYSCFRPDFIRDIIAVVVEPGNKSSIYIGHCVSVIRRDCGEEIHLFATPDLRFFDVSCIVGWCYVEDALPEFEKLRKQMEEKFQKNERNVKMNTIILTGNLVKEPDYREFPNGGGVCTLRVADNRRFTGKDGKTREETLFIDVKAYKGLATTCRQFLSKGSKILVAGELKQEEYTTKDGQKRTTLYISAKQIEFLSSLEEERAPRHSHARQNAVPDDYDPRKRDNAALPERGDNPDADIEDTPF